MTTHNQRRDLNKKLLPYVVRSFARGRSFSIIGPGGHEVYDNEPHGKDKPLIFHDEDTAQDACNRMNEAASEGESDAIPMEPEPCGDCDPCIAGHPEQCAISPTRKQP